MTRVKLVKKEEVAANTGSFFFSKPQGYAYTPGQFTEITLLTPPEEDTIDTVREFTISSAPHEEHIMFTMRLRESPFKKLLMNLPYGGEIEIDIPYGNFLLPDDKEKPVVMIAGGIGITPFRSMLVQAQQDSNKRKITLFSFNRTVKDAAFLKDLTLLTNKQDATTFIPVMTQDESWAGQKGHFTEMLLSERVPDAKKQLFYVSGPARFIAAVTQTLLKAGIGSENIKVDEFAGY